jgi:hypothetical protein
LPAFEQRLGSDGFDLLSEAVHIDVHHGVVGFIRRTAKRVGDEDNAEAPVDRAKHGRQHADIGFAAGDDDGVDPGAAQLLDSPINAASNPLPESPVSLTHGGVIPHITFRSPRLRLGELESHPAKRLLQQYRGQSGLIPTAGQCRLRPEGDMTLDQVGRYRAVASLTPRSQENAGARIECKAAGVALLQPFNVPWLESVDTLGGPRCRSSRAPRAPRTLHARQQAAPAPRRKPRSIFELDPPSAP